MPAIYHYCLTPFFEMQYSIMKNKNDVILILLTLQFEEVRLAGLLVTPLFKNMK